MVHSSPAKISLRQIPREMRPVVTSAYWDGNVLGDGSGEPPLQPSGIRQEGRLPARFLAMVVSHVGRDGSLREIENGERYTAGMLFSTDSHTVKLALFRKEELSRTGSTIPYPDMSKLEAVETPPPSTDLHVDFSVPPLVRAAADRIAGAGLVYRSAVHIGATGPDINMRPALFSVPHGRISRGVLDPGLQLSDTWGSEIQPNPLRIGEVQHNSGEDWRDERLVRVTALAVVSADELS